MTIENPQTVQESTKNRKRLENTKNLLNKTLAKEYAKPQTETKINETDNATDILIFKYGLF